MSSLDYTTLSRGPAQIKVGASAYFQTKGDAVLDWGLSFKDIPSASFGPLGKIRDGRKPTLSFDLIGAAENFNILFPFANAAIGSSLRGTSDVEVLVQPIDSTQKQKRFRAGVMTKFVNAKFSARDTLFQGNAEFSFFPKNNTDDADPNLFYIEETNTITSPTYDPSTVIVAPAVASWLSGNGTAAYTYGANSTAALVYNVTAAALATALNALASITAAGGVTVTGDYVNGFKVTFVSNGVRTNITGTVAGIVPSSLALTQTILTTGAAGVAQIVLLQLTPWANFTHQDGITLNFGITTSDIENDALGRIDTILSSVSVTADMTPQGLSDTVLNAAIGIQGANSRLGLVSSGLFDLNIVGGVYARVYAAQLLKVPNLYSGSKNRIGQIQFSATRSAGSGGALNPLFAISTTPIP